MQPSRVSDIIFEAVPGPAQFKLRPPGAIVHVRRDDCRVRRIAAPTGLERIAGCVVGPVQCKDTSYR
eukprot:1482858-Alexandrium_andersonii.AAC.1